MTPEGEKCLRCGDVKGESKGNSSLTLNVGLILFGTIAGILGIVLNIFLLVLIGTIANIIALFKMQTYNGKYK
jgi:hypothetical protein